MAERLEINETEAGNSLQLALELSLTSSRIVVNLTLEEDPLIWLNYLRT